MIEDFRILCQVKSLQEKNKLKVLRAKRKAVEAALIAETAQQGIVSESSVALPAKQAAVFDAIMQLSVSVSEIDAVKAKVMRLHEDHQKQEDEAERLTQVRLEYETELDEAVMQYQIAQRSLEKFTTIKADLVLQQANAAETEEDAEIEDLFAKGRSLLHDIH